MAFPGTPRFVRSVWSLVLLAALIAVNEGLALAGYPRIPSLYADTALGLALVGVLGTLGRNVALAACSLVVLYMAAVLLPAEAARNGTSWISHLATVGAAFYGVIFMIDHFLRRLERQQTSLEQAQALARVGSWDWDIARQRLKMSREARRLFGMRDDVPVSAESTWALVHPDDLPRLAAASEAAEREGRDFVVTYRVVTEGCTREVESRGQVIRGSDGRPLRIAGTVQDVTERMDAERAIRTSHERLVALDRLKDDFVSSVSHELRTPLTSVKGYLEFLADELGGPLSPSQHGYVANARAGAARLERLVDDLLDFALLEAGEFRLEAAPTDVAAVARRVLGILGAQASERNVSLTLEGDELSRLPVVDEARVEQVLINLVGNALKFTPVGGHVVVRITLAHSASALRIEVADNGPGLPPEAQARLFEKFYRLHRAGDVVTGTGLGLAIAKHLVEAHGGAIGVDSVLGAGSTFWFLLPLGEETARVPTAAA